MVATRTPYGDFNVLDKKGLTEDILLQLVPLTGTLTNGFISKIIIHNYKVTTHTPHGDFNTLNLRIFLCKMALQLAPLAGTLIIIFLSLKILILKFSFVQVYKARTLPHQTQDSDHI